MLQTITIKMKELKSGYEKKGMKHLRCIEAS